MQLLQTAIIEHTTPDGVHHDWLIEDPTLQNPKAKNARLWTARVAPPPHEWAKIKRFDLTVIPPHRRIYLDYQGPVSGNRGRVQRRAKGSCYAKLWTADRIVMSMQCDAVELDLDLIRQAGDHWAAVVL
ncbi:MAG: hypothetical protein AB8C95_04090 [Phycisphaeraceae bacterium]